MPSRRILLRGDVAIAITPKAFDTLVALVEWRDRVVSREELLSHLWPGVAVEEANLTQQVFLLRKALDESGTGEQYIATVPRRGYRFVKDVALVPLESESGAPAQAPQQAPPELRRIIAAGVLIVATAGIAHLAMSRPTDPPPSRNRPFATAEAVESMPAWSPDGRTLAFGAEKDGYYQIHIQRIDPATPTPIRLTDLDADCLFPAWDPTGSRIFFLISRVPQHGEIWVADVAGGEPQRVVSDVMAFALAPTTGELAFLRHDGDSVSLWRADADGRGSRKLAVDRSLGEQMFLAFSPDGRWLGIKGPRGPDLLLLPHPFDDRPLEKGRSIRFRGPDGELGVYYFFSWSPTGDEIVFSSREGDGGDPRLWVGNLTQLTARPFGASLEWELMPAISRDGRVAFVTTPMDWDVFEIPLDAPELRPLVVGARFDSWADWMPHGRGLVFSTNRRGHFEIWRRNLDDGTDQVLVAPGAFSKGSTLFLAQSDVSSDGARLAYKRLGFIYLQTILGSEPVRLTNAVGGTPREDNPSWSPDDRWVLFRRGFTSIMKAPTTGQAQPTLLTDDSSRSITAEPKWAAGGSDVVYVGSDGLRRISSTGGESRILTRDVPVVWDVARDGRTAFGILEGPHRAMRLVRIDLTSGDVRDVAHLGRFPVAPMPIGYLPTLQGLRISPDGTRLALSRLNARSDIYIREARRPVRQ